MINFSQTLIYSLGSKLQLSKHLQYSTTRNKVWKELYTVVYKQNFGNVKSRGEINSMVCYSVAALQEFFMLFLEASDTSNMGDGSQNSWSSNLIQFSCMMETYSSLVFFVSSI